MYHTISLLLIAVLLVSVNAHVKFAGITNAQYDGRMTAFFHDQNGYDDAKLACEAEFPGSHVCVDSEVGIIAQTDSLSVVPFGGGIRFIDMALGETVDGKPVNDCRGFTSNSTEIYSVCLTHKLGGPILPEFCDCSRFLQFMCCVDL
eukprot:TRINITY_DN8670_c0_g1_i1.p1 TRINITY_DN8670_c0_g1~~TRINITY_DN8670_c0_g1_i1.p1  ORF type:complete len:147 (-),score=35.72 TRINITY_DN8670_c0_g1_i1:43-483(-)